MEGRTKIVENTKYEWFRSWDASESVKQKETLWTSDLRELFSLALQECGEDGYLEDRQIGGNAVL